MEGHKEEKRYLSLKSKKTLDVKGVTVSTSKPLRVDTVPIRPLGLHWVRG